MKQSHAEKIIKTGEKYIEDSSAVKPLGVQIDDELNFHLDIINICRSAANQSPLKKFQNVLRF